MATRKRLTPRFLKPAFNSGTYEYDDKFQPGNPSDPTTVHTTSELVACLERNENVSVDALVLGWNKSSKEWTFKRLGKKEFLEAFKSGNKRFTSKFRESIDAFGTDAAIGNVGAVGDDFIPLLGGNFYKNLYFYDYIRMANECFWAAHHDPLARQIVNITRDFTLGRGFKVDSDNQTALAVWEAFENANDLQGMMDQVARELPTYGETMLWWLPENQTKIVQRPYPGQEIPKGMIPRVRLIDPSVIWEIVTWPEDITKVLYYVWVAPTAWQTYTGMAGQAVPSTKFIFQSIPADQVMHFKINNYVGEKRGRSDLFPILGYLKRMRDSINYQLVALQKQSAYAVDVTVKGNQNDVDAYVSAQEDLGPIPQAGSEFVHTDAIERKYLSAEGTKTGSSQAFDWNLSMIAAGVGIPISYFGTHISGGQTRASAIVATEPVAKKFEMRQQVYERIIRSLWDRVMEWAGLGHVEMNVIFPQIITQDRTAMMKDLALAEVQKWISKDRAAMIAAKELGVTDFDYDREKEKIAKDGELPNVTINPLTGAPKVQKDTSAVTSEEKKQIKTYG